MTIIMINYHYIIQNLIDPSPNRLLLEHITSKHGRGMKSFKDFSETLRFFDEQTTQHIEKSNASQKDSKHQFKKFGKSSSSSSESELIRKLNRIVKVR